MGLVICSASSISPLLMDPQLRVILRRLAGQQTSDGKWTQTAHREAFQEFTTAASWMPMPATTILSRLGTKRASTFQGYYVRWLGALLQEDFRGILMLSLPFCQFSWKWPKKKEDKLRRQLVAHQQYLLSLLLYSKWRTWGEVTTSFAPGYYILPDPTTANLMQNYKSWGGHSLMGRTRH